MKLVTILFALMAAALLMAADSQILGTWQVIAEAPNGDHKATLTVKEEGGKLGGTLGDFSLIDAKFEGDVFTFKVKAEDQLVAFKTKVSGGKLEGTWAGPSHSGGFKGSKE